jgi:hypothetical protein
VPPVEILPAFDETKYGVACFDLSLEAPPVQELALESYDEALCNALSYASATESTDGLSHYAAALSD